MAQAASDPQLKAGFGTHLAGTYQRVEHSEIAGCGTVARSAQGVGRPQYVETLRLTEGGEQKTVGALTDLAETSEVTAMNA